MAYQAQDTFVADLKDGSTRRVTRGEVFPDGHELVKRDLAGSQTLFKPLDLGESPLPVKRPRGRPRRTPAVAVPAEDSSDEDEGRVDDHSSGQRAGRPGADAGVHI